MGVGAGEGGNLCVGMGEMSYLLIYRNVDVRTYVYSKIYKVLQKKAFSQEVHLLACVLECGCVQNCVK